MNTTTITEACGCGASITVTTGYSFDARRALDEWRKGHKHVDSVGIAEKSKRPAPHIPLARRRA